MQKNHEQICIAAASMTAAVALMTAGCGKKTDPAGTGQSTGEETVPSGAENESTEDPEDNAGASIGG